MSDIIVIGGGAAGMMAAIAAAGADAGERNQVTLIEKNEKLGKKVFITGKGRCNVTNACEVQELLGMSWSIPSFSTVQCMGLTIRLSCVFFRMQAVL